MLIVGVQVGKNLFSSVDSAISHIIKTLDNSIEGAAVPLGAELKRSLQLVANELARKHGTQWSGGTSGSNLFKRSGDGLDSIKDSISVSGGSISSMAGRITAGKMGVHERGATIRAKAGGYLTIPLPAALDSRGVPLRKRARDWDNTFVARSKRGNLIIFQKKGRKNIRPLYVLKTSVRLRPRLGLGDMVHSQAIPYFQRKALDVIEREIDRRL